MEQLLSGSIWQNQINGLQGYHTVVLRCQQTCHYPNQCIPKRPQCCPPSRWPPSYLHFQSSYTCGAALCQHRMWTAHLCLQSRAILHLCLWLCLHNWEWQQSSWTDQDQKSSRYTCSSTENAATTPKLLCHHQILTWQRDAGCRWSLSHYAPLKAPEIPLDITINHVHITPDRKTEFQTLIQDDLLLCFLTETITVGWPDNINDVPHALHPYHGHSNILTVEDGLILQGEDLIIPPSEREKILQAIHKGHMGISKCQSRARHCVYWPGIKSHIKPLVESCETYQHHHP